MEFKKFTKQDEGVEYQVFEETDFEYLNPKDYFKETRIKQAYHLLNLDILSSNIASSSIITNQMVYLKAVQVWEEFSKEIDSTEIPNQLISILTASTKNEQVKLLKGATINPMELFAWLIKAGNDFGYCYSQYIVHYYPNNVNQSDLPKFFHLDNNVMKKVGPTNLTDEELKNIIFNRKVTISKFLDKGNEWHCLFITYSSLAGKEGWQGGQPHYHYISDKFGMSREKVLSELKSRNYNLGSLPHINLLDYSM